MPDQHAHPAHVTRFATTDPERSEAYLSASYSASVRFSGVRDGFQFRHVRRGLGWGRFYIDTLTHEALTEFRTGPLPALVVVRMLAGLRTVVDRGDRYGPGDLFLTAQPHAPHHVRNVYARYTAVLVPLQAAAEVCRNRPDEDLGPLRFTSLRPASPADTLCWLRAVDYAGASLRANPEAMTQPILAGATTRLLAAALVNTFPNTWRASEPDHQDRVDATPTALARAIAFMDANADLDITAADIARAAHVTVRAVQLAFRRHLDTTPMAYLRRVRLERAHEQLRGANPGDGTTVTAVAARWGYASLSQFTSRYRLTYGQPPSHTLRN
jgi:AraC-like DNA-binding protein